MGLLFHDFDAIHARHLLHRDEGEDDLALGIGSNASESPIDGPSFPARLLEDVKAAQKGNSVAVDIEQPAPQAAAAAVAAPVVTLAELQRDAVAAVGDGHGVREMAPSLARIERGVVGGGVPLLRGI